MLSKSFGVKLQAKLTELDLNQSEFGALVGCTRAYIHNLIHGKRLPTDRMLVAMAPILQVPLATLRQWSDEARYGTAQAQAQTGGGRFYDGIFDSPAYKDALHKPSLPELKILKEAQDEGIFWGAVTMVGFWDQPESERERSFDYLRLLIRESQDLKKRSGVS